MPLYRIQLKQGSRTITNHIEADNVDSVLGFFNAVSTMQVSEILEVKYRNDSQPPVDDFNYKKLYKGFLRDSETGLSKQIVLQNIKQSINEKELANYMKQYLTIGGKKVDSVYCSLFKI